jgi:hypothetical protein
LTPPPSAFDDLRGASRLAVDAVTGMTDLAENVHRTITRLAPPLGAPTTERTQGVTGFVYRRVRRTTRLVGRGIEATLSRLPARLSGTESSEARDGLRAVVNGIVGDHLAATDNPLAIPMALCHDGAPLSLDRDALAQRFGPASGRLLVLAHGLCMDERGWQRDGHDHGAALARDLSMTPLYLRYNSGRAIADNGQDFADLLENALDAWPVPVRELAFVGHSMGGLVMRSACHIGTARDHRWLPLLSRVVFLGSPHYGSPLERAGHAVDRALGIGPYTAPFARLGLIRSQGIQDLRHGRYLDVPAVDTPELPRALPEHIACFALAATRRPSPGLLNDTLGDLVGDGLVPVASALGRHADAEASLPIPDAHQRVVYGLNHFDLLSDRTVYAQLRRWLR